jgi:hypothetical protein
MLPSTKGFYEVQLFVLAAFCAAAFLAEKYVSARRTRLSLSGTNGHARQPSAWKAKSAGYAHLLKDYLIVYTIVMGACNPCFRDLRSLNDVIGADWLQGPYVYSLYHEQYKYPEHTVALLFVTGFTSAGFFAPIVGDWADQKCVILLYMDIHSSLVLQWTQTHLHHLLHGLCGSLSPHAYPRTPYTPSWSCPRRFLHIHPLLLLRIVAHFSIIFHKVRLSLSKRNLLNHGACDYDERFRCHRCRCSQQLPCQAYAELSLSLHGEFGTPYYRLLHHREPVGRKPGYQPKWCLGKGHL